MNEQIKLNIERRFNILKSRAQISSIVEGNSSHNVIDFFLLLVLMLLNKIRDTKCKKSWHEKIGESLLTNEKIFSQFFFYSLKVFSILLTFCANCWFLSVTTTGHGNLIFKEMGASKRIYTHIFKWIHHTPTRIHAHTQPNRICAT